PPLKLGHAQIEAAPPQLGEALPLLPPHRLEVAPSRTPADLQMMTLLIYEIICSTAPNRHIYDLMASGNMQPHACDGDGCEFNQARSLVSAPNLSDARGRHTARVDEQAALVGPKTT